MAKEAGRLYRWREKFWSRRYRAIVVSDEPKARVARLRYVLEIGPIPAPRFHAATGAMRKSLELALLRVPAGP